MINNYKNKMFLGENNKGATLDDTIITKKKNIVVNLLHELNKARELNESKLNRVIQILKE